MIKIPAEVKQIAEIFKKNNKTLYTVGGFNRDSYLGIQSLLRDDIDLCSNVKPKELFKMFEGTGFEIKNINESLGVMAIVGKKRYEHATFRKEYYETESHTPTKVEFINSLEEDAKRRDFRINAIYYNVSENSFIDPLGGIDDLRERKITTVKPPKMVFNDDPERILRLVRFASALGLSIPEEEMFYAKQNAYKIKFISKFRLRAEFERLLTADQMYPELTYTRDAHFRAMVLLGELDAWKDILPVMEDMKNTQVVDKKGEKIYDHILNCLKNASPKIRLAVLLHDAGKVKTLELNKRMFGAKEFVETIVNKNLGIDGLGYAKQVVSKVTKTIIGYDFNSWCLASKKAVKRFIFKNHDVIENIIEIKNVAKSEGKGSLRKIRSAEILRKTYNEMLKEGAPFDLRDLKINGDDIIQAFPKINLEYLDNLLDDLLFEAALCPKKNNKQELLVVADKLIKSKRDIYLEF
ncbi:MAG: CCA tRNA nucleotidyltransferase [Clostridia bacterium]|nr:CCA tRNA nucleotidyltransferase [Clostridia bacterium]